MINTSVSLIADMLRQSMDEGQIPFLTITSNSMVPLLKTGDQVGLEPIQINHLAKGDIVTLVQGEHLLTHRFWGCDDQGRPFTRGDRPLIPDAPGEAGQLIGQVVVCRRHNRELSLQFGIGRRLNQHLAWLVRVESYVLTGQIPLPFAPLLPPGRQRKLIVRLVRRAFFSWASLAVTILGGLARQNRKQELT
jgi:hypothetical protein